MIVFVTDSTNIRGMILFICMLCLYIYHNSSLRRKTNYFHLKKNHLDSCYFRTSRILNSRYLDHSLLLRLHKGSENCSNSSQSMAPHCTWNLVQGYIQKDSKATEQQTLRALKNTILQ